MPSPTWARHSFATNLNNSGVVPYKYISDSMGQKGIAVVVTSLPITSVLIRLKNVGIQSLFAQREPKSTATFVDKKAALLEMLKDMSEEERKELIAGLSN